MTSRRLTISCPGCRDEFKDVTVDEAERILFHGCAECREAKSESTVEREALEVQVDEAEIPAEDEIPDEAA